MGIAEMTRQSEGDPSEIGPIDISRGREKRERRRAEDRGKMLEVGGAALRQAQGLEVGGKTKEVSGPLSIVREA